jgi:hypothetical protein
MRFGRRQSPTMSEGESAGGDDAHRAFATQDIEADHMTLRARGVELGAEIARTCWSGRGVIVGLRRLVTALWMTG